MVAESVVAADIDVCTVAVGVVEVERLVDADGELDHVRPPVSDGATVREGSGVGVSAALAVALPVFEAVC